MRIRIYVEGPTEQVGLPRLLAHLKLPKRRIDVLPLKGSRFLKEIGRRAAVILTREHDSHVFACPDLAPRDSYEGTQWAYTDYESLQDVLQREVREALKERLGARKLVGAMRRFHAHPFRHDFEVVLLACPELLKRRLGTEADISKHYSRKPEDQDFEQYPKKVVQRLFRKFAKRRYRPTYDCPRVLDYMTAEHVNRIRRACPRFGELATALEQLLSA